MRGRRLRKILRPFQEFFAREASGGVLLIVAAVAALVIANSPMASMYFAWKEVMVTLSLGDWVFKKDVIHVVNDGFMALFFFVVGLEIKRELLVGELSSWRKSSVPVFAAMGGMAGPALIYVFINRGTPEVNGWGVPTATDIAFALGILGLLGSKVPVTARVFLAALAIMDDIGAVLLIALFYSKGIQADMLAYGGVVVLAMLGLNVLGIRKITPYAVCAVVLWAFVFKSGLHPTIAGVLAAFTIPAKTRINVPEFLERTRELLAAFRDSPTNDEEGVLTEDQQSVVEEIEKTTEGIGTPLQTLIHVLHPWVAFLVVPVFAFFNAGVALGSGLPMVPGVVSGVAIGLVVGKPVGIVLLVATAVKLKLGELPKGLGWSHITGLGFLAGIGFTMSLFIAGLAFRNGASIESAKVGVLTGSAVAAVLGTVLLLTARKLRRALAGS